MDPANQPTQPAAGRDIRDLLPNVKNPRRISEHDFKALEQSIQKFGDLSCIVFNVRTGQLVGGHQRINAMKNQPGVRIEMLQPYPLERDALGTVGIGHIIIGQAQFPYREVDWDAGWEAAANIAANRIQGEFDLELLAQMDYELSQLENGEELLRLSGQDDAEIKKLLASVGVGEDEQAEEHGSLTDAFLVPPFSILDTRQGYWQSRARAWGDRIGDVSATREGTLGLTSLAGDKYGGKAFAASGVSELDPVLCEVSYKWFMPGPGTVFNPFGGEPVSAFVAAATGNRYHGTEIRPEQVTETYTKIGLLTDEQKALVNLQVGDARHCGQIFAGTTADLVFSSPPFYDLEVYSDRPEDMSTLGTYAEFMESYRQAFTGAVSLLNDNRFVVINITEIRDKGGVYRNFVGDNVKLFTDLGLQFYNDIIIVNAIGTAAIRAARNMGSRKVVRVHQNLLVFYKGNIKDIKNHFPALEVEMPAEFAEDDKTPSNG
jgi:hypothetical protein